MLRNKKRGLPGFASSILPCSQQPTCFHQNYPTNEIDIIVMIRIVPEQHGGLDREKHNPPPRSNHPCLPSMRGSRHLEMRKMTLVRVILTMVIVAMVTLVKTSGTYRKPPSRSSFLNDTTAILDETLQIEGSVLCLFLPIITAAVDTPAQGSSCCNIRATQ